MAYESKHKMCPVLPKWQPHPYKVIPILVLYSEDKPRGIFTYLLDYDKTFTLYCGAVFIAGVEGYNILVDSGPSEQDFERLDFPYTIVKPIKNALKGTVGLQPEDIDIVLVTHLHHDHCSNMDLYKNARIIVQKDEWDSLDRPPVAYRSLYNADYLKNVKPTFVDGDAFNIVPGLHLLFTPGHTFGTQSVVVDTEDGRVIVCGICCDEANFNPPAEYKILWPEVLLPGLHTDTEEAYDSMLRIKREAKYIVTLHDEKTYKRGPCPGSGWPVYE